MISIANSQPRRPLILARFLVQITGLMFAGLILLGTFSPTEAKPQFSAIAVDARTGKILFSNAIDGVRHPASLTKVMTLYLVFQDLKAERLKLTSELKVSRRAASMQPSKLGLKPGSTISVENAIKALVTRSANDVAATIGENLEGSEANFAIRMTRVARAIGMTKTTFKNASGLPNPAQVTTARDMATLSLRIQRDFPEYYPYFRLTSFTYKGQTIRTHNRLLGKYQGTDGIKTGYIAASGFNLTTSAKRGDKRIVGVVMGSSSGNARNKYMMKMLDNAFPKCVEGEAIAAVAGSSDGAMVPTVKTAEVTPRQKPLAVASVIDVKVPEAGTDVKKTTSKAETTIETVLADEEKSAAPDSKVLEAKIAETVVEPVEKPTQPAKTTEKVPTKLPFAVKKQATVDTAKKVVASVDPTWNIQIGAYPKKEEARLKLKEIRASGYKFLSGKQAFTVQVQKGSKTVYRARFSGFTQKTAKAACAQLSKKGLKCMAFSPQS
ncbi:MAG TPA: D-alanyl-D-alanine carboxypeptidase [Aestuariivirga sp.]|nr:D-alanyl-D-alanine carboxypeptidase [Aestuariivirga sp.]